MCGIAGWQWGASGVPGKLDPRKVLQDMAGRMTHRGPDADGFFLDGRTGLAHRRLSIIDLDTGKQPLGNEDGSVQVVFNGEIYNFMDIRRDLLARGHKLATRSDTEVLVHLWEDFGPKMLERLRGMFAFAIYDSRDGTLFLARDRLGVKPLLYAETPAGIFFASELYSLLAAPDVRPVLDLEALDLYLGLQYVPAPRSIYSTIKKLPPAHYLLAKAGRIEKIERYWSISPAPRLFDRRAAIEQLIWELQASRT